MALDAALYDGRGCLSPARVLVAGGDSGRARDFASALAGALADLEQTLPPGVLQAAEALALRELRARVAMGSPPIIDGSW